MRHPLVRFRSWSMLVLAVVTVVVDTGAGPGPDPERPPRLAVVIAIDGLTPGPFAALESLYVGGFRRLLEEGASFTDCQQDHAFTYTGPGHFALLSGRFPGPVGIISNSWYDRAKGDWVYCVEDPAASLVGGDTPGEPGSAGSYRPVAATALGDWMVAANPASRVVSIAGKDRSAILMGGRTAHAVYWFDRGAGRFVTTDAVSGTVHPWVASMDDPVERYAGARWERIVADTAVYEATFRADDFPGERNLSCYGAPDCIEPAPIFDHFPVEGRDLERARVARGISYFPFLDEMVLELGLRAIEAEALGQDDVPDLLCLGFSALDRVSHRAGPWSQESMDVLLRLDRSLDELLRHLDDVVGEGRYVVALSSDHGFRPLVAQSRARGERAEAIGDRGEAFRDRVVAAIEAELGVEDPFAETTRTWYYLDHTALRVAGVSDDRVIGLVRREAQGVEWIDRVLARTELMGEGPPDDDLLRRYRHSLHPSRSPEIMLVPAPWILMHRNEMGSTHGSPHPVDAHVPLLFLGPGIHPGVYGELVRSVDVAPTVAHVLEVAVPGEVDGVSLRRLLVR